MINTQLFKGNKIEFTELDLEKDSPIIAEWTKDPCAFKRIMEGKYRLVSAAAVKKSLTETLKKSDERKDSFYFAVRTLEAQDLVGFARFPVFVPIHQFASLRLDFANDGALKDYGAETLNLMAYYGFMELNLFRIDTRVSACELEMMSLYEQFGFSKDIIRREANFHYGSYFDEIVFGMNQPLYKDLYREVKQ
jgi:RimJ/RimL family protein N-acetyltransferase